MRFNQKLKSSLVGVFVAALALMGTSASGAVIGTMNIANSGGQGLTLSLTAIDFLPAGGGLGAMTTGAGTGLSFAGGGPVISGLAGAVADINLAAPLPLLNFMTIAVEPALSFDLVSIGPGVVNTVAVNSFDPNSAPASPAPGSPYILQATATGTSLTFSVAGIANDTSSPDSLWSGLFTTQFAGVTPFQVQQALLGSNSLTSTWSASIVATGFIPEPASLAMVLMGLCPMLRSRRRA